MNAPIRTILTGAACGAAILVPAGVAGAHRGGDRDRDGLPDRYERSHHLSVKSNSALGDPDSDGLSNRLERKLRLDPQKADTDGDGVLDGAEDNDGDGIANADEGVGHIASFSGGVLTIKLPDGTTVTGKVTDRTRVQCKGTEDDGDEGESDDDGHAHGQGHSVNCGPAALVSNAKVRKADLRLGTDGAVFKKVEIVG